MRRGLKKLIDDISDPPTDARDKRKLTEGLVAVQNIANEMGTYLERDYAFAEPDQKWKDGNRLIELGRKQRRLIEDTLIDVYGDPDIPYRGVKP